jgi:disulfide oxidoreductase YuzD
MQGEIGFWKESDVETAILRFSIKKNEKDEIKSISINPTVASIEKGKTQSFYAIVEITGNAVKNVTWTVEGASASSIDSSGVLKIDAKETSTNLTVKATSKFDNTKFSIATVAITSAVSDVKVQKAKDKVAKASNVSPIILKNVLLQILEKYPQVAEIIDENLDE